MIPHERSTPTPPAGARRAQQASAARDDRATAGSQDAGRRPRSGGTASLGGTAMTVPRPDPGTPEPGRPGIVPPGWAVPMERPDRLPRSVSFVEGGSSDLDDQLARRRIVLLSGRLDPEQAQAAAARLMLADADGPEPVQLRVSCPDGDLGAAVMLAETIQLMRARVVATASGLVGGVAVAVYAAGRHRRAHPHARFALSEPRASIAGPAGIVAAETAVHRDRAEFLAGVITAATGHDVRPDLTARRILSADEALTYGLVQEIVR